MAIAAGAAEKERQKRERKEKGRERKEIQKNLKFRRPFFLSLFPISSPLLKPQPPPPLHSTLTLWDSVAADQKVWGRGCLHEPHAASESPDRHPHVLRVLQLDHQFLLAACLSRLPIFSNDNELLQDPSHEINRVTIPPKKDLTIFSFWVVPLRCFISPSSSSGIKI